MPKAVIQRSAFDYHKDRRRIPPRAAVDEAVAAGWNDYPKGGHPTKWLPAGTLAREQGGSSSDRYVIDTAQTALTGAQ